MAATPLSDAPPRPRAGWWQCRAVNADRVPVWFAVVWSAAHADGAVVELIEDAARIAVGDDAVCTAGYDEHQRVTRLQVGAATNRKAPPLWFAELRESTATPPATNLLAFAGAGRQPGSLLDESALGDVAVESTDQLAAVRWYPATGEVHQIYVNPAQRRNGIGSALIAAGTTLSLARGWPRFWGDGQRTELGERWRSASPWRHRAAALTHLAPPMTPGGTPDR